MPTDLGLLTLKQGVEPGQLNLISRHILPQICHQSLAGITLSLDGLATLLQRLQRWTWMGISTAVVQINSLYDLWYLIAMTTVVEKEKKKKKKKKWLGVWQVWRLLFTQRSGNKTGVGCGTSFLACLFFFSKSQQWRDAIENSGRFLLSVLTCLPLRHTAWKNTNKWTNS